MKRELKILLASAGFSTFVYSMLGPIYAIFVEEIGGGVLEASYAISIFTFVSGVLIYLLTRWEDKVKHQEKLLILGYFLSSIGFFSYILVTKPFHIYIIEVIFGLAVAVLSPVYDGLYSKNLDKGKFISEWGDWESMAYIVSSLSALSGGILAKYFGFRFLFFVMFLLSLIPVFVSLALLKREKKNVNLSNLRKRL